MAYVAAVPFVLVLTGINTLLSKHLYAYYSQIDRNSTVMAVNDSFYDRVVTFGFVSPTVPYASLAGLKMRTLEDRAWLSFVSRLTANRP